MSAPTLDSSKVYFGVYECQRCKKAYTVNDGTWRHCTPDLCHDCCEWLFSTIDRSDL